MADVTGPISTLPGSIHRVPERMQCDNNCGRAAEIRIQGETDSFGSEMIDLCRPCWERERAQISEPVTENCDWCKKASNELRPIRDIDEGMHGPVYYVCADCRKKQDEAIEEESRYYESLGYDV